MTPALAIAWEFRRRYRWGLTALAVYLVALAIITVAVAPASADITFRTLDDPLGTNTFVSSEYSVDAKRTQSHFRTHGPTSYI